jgi:hypothetical protein
MDREQEWTRTDAELRIREVLNNAKSGHAQLIMDGDGIFEIRFVEAKTKERAGDYLARGGPDERNGG